MSCINGDCLFIHSDDFDAVAFIVIAYFTHHEPKRTLDNIGFAFSYCPHASLTFV